MPSDDVATITGTAPVVGIDGSRPAGVSATENITRATFGLTWQHRNGFFVGGGVGWNVPTKERRRLSARTSDQTFGDFVDWQVRLGYHPGVRVYVPPPPPPPPPAPPPAPRPRRTGRRS